MYRLEETVNFVVSENGVLNVNKVFNFVDSTVTEFVINNYAIPNLTVDMVLEIGRITTCKYIYIESDKDVTVKFNSTSNTGYSTRFILINTSATSIYVSNSSGQVANVKVILLGI